MPRWGKMRAADINRSDVKVTVACITSPSVANQTLAATSAIFSWAMREEIGGVFANPCAKVVRHETKSRERVLSDSEVPRLWTALENADLMASAALRLILLTGQRPGEVSSMRREHIRDGWWEMPGEPIAALGWPGTKNKQAHRVWLPAPAREIIHGLTQDDEASGFVLVGARGRRVANLDGAMRIICSELGVERVTPHDLRRTHGTMITRLGFGREAMNRIQNHKDGGIASVYDRHGYGDENQRIMEAVAAYLIAQVEGASGTDKVVALRR
jgi:integrase